MTIIIDYNRNRKYFIYYCDLLFRGQGNLFLFPLLFEKSFAIMDSRVSYESDYQSKVTKMSEQGIGFE